MGGWRRLSRGGEKKWNCLVSRGEIEAIWRFYARNLRYQPNDWVRPRQRRAPRNHEAVVI